MKIVKTKKAIASLSKLIHKDGGTIAFVPTMGALHEGHLSLVRIARKLADTVIVSIYVNPTQFGPNEDFSRYPRPFNEDLAKLKKEGVNVLFAPSNLYDFNSATFIDPGYIASVFCGASRIDHFRGVATVVLKLFNLVNPDIAIFGQKDAQQVCVIKQMVRDLDHPVKIVVAPIVREADGLALSSRNRYLTPDERSRANSLYNALNLVKKELAKGTNINSALNKGKRVAKGDIEYLNVVNQSTFLPIKKIEKNALVIGAMRLGKTRLIDNLKL